MPASFRATSSLPEGGEGGKVPPAGCQRSPAFRWGREGSGGPSGEASPPEARASEQREEGASSRDVLTTPRPPPTPAETAQRPDRRELTRDRRVDHAEDADGEAGARARGVGGSGGPPTPEGWTPRSCSRRRRRASRQGGRPARAAPPPPARASRAATVTPRGPARARAHARWACGLEPAARLTPLGFAPAANPPPCLGSAVCGGRKCGRALHPHRPTHGRRERRPRPLRGAGRLQAPPQRPLSCFDAPRGGAWEERLPGSAWRPGGRKARRLRHFQTTGPANQERP